MTDAIQSLGKSLSADIQQLNTISHNVANISTLGFRAEKAVLRFEDQLGSINVNRTVDTSDGAIANTNRKYDFALQGKGFFSVERNGEVLLTRAGNFRVDSSGMLVNANGDTVLSDINGFKFSDEPFEVDKNGQILVADRVVGRLQLVDVEDASLLIPLDGAYRYTGKLAAWQGTIQQGALEQSNVDAADESIKLMELTRHVESLQRAISIYDKALDIGINKIGEN